MKFGLGRVLDFTSTRRKLLYMSTKTATLITVFHQFSQVLEQAISFTAMAGIHTISVLASNKRAWDMRKAFLCCVPILTQAQSEKYFELETYKMFVPLCISLFPTNQDHLERELGLLMTIDGGRNLSQLNITGLSRKSKRSDLNISALDGAFPRLRKLKLTNLIVHGQLLNYSDKVLDVSCRECIISPSARLGCGKVSIHYITITKPFDWSPVRYAKRLKLVVLPPARGLWCSFKEVGAKLLVQDLHISGEVSISNGFAIRNLSYLKTLTFTPERAQYLSIEGCSELETVVTSSGKYRVNGEGLQAGGDFLISGERVTKLLQLSPE